MTHEKVDHIIKKKNEKKKSVLFNDVPEVKNYTKELPKSKIVEKEPKEKLKINKNETKEQATNMIKNFSDGITTETAKKEAELTKQEESFKTRLLQKMNKQKIVIGCSEPHNIQAVIFTL